jgi:hypothetical protein
MINIANRRECFFDNFLINEEKTTAEARLNKPVRRGVILELDRPWEGKYNTFFCPIYAEGKWRLYYTSTLSPKEKYVSYAESDDGQSWMRPSLGIVEFQGSKDNNIIMNLAMFAEFEFTGFDNFSVFYDENPDCLPDERYKMVAWWQGHAALLALFSTDGIHFTKSRLVTDDGEFDSQNRAFWSDYHKKYFCYYRGEHEPSDDISIIDRSYTDKTANALFDPEKFLLREPGDGTFSFMRDVRVIESCDFVNWSEQKPIKFNGSDYQLYNNVVFPYPRAPHLFVAFPLRYVERKAWTKNYDELCGRDERRARMKQMARLGLAISDGLFMLSRDGVNFTKYDEALIPPPAENPEAFVYGDGTAAPALIEVPSEIPGADNEYMIIVRESFRATDGYNKLVKYISRLDGFVSLHAGGEERKIVTKEFVYDGADLFANIQTSARGYAYFTLKSSNEEYTSVEVFGNSTNKRIRFENDDAVKALSGKPVTLEIKLFDCDIYSIKFNK